MRDCEGSEMQNADTILAIYQKRGAEGLPLENVYKRLFDPELYLRAYGKIYRNYGAMTKGTTKETVDGMDLQRIHNIIGILKWERWKWNPVRRVMIPKPNGKMRPLGIPTWSDKLLQEVMRLLLEPYYEQKFSDRSHSFRPDRGCHTALRNIKETWTGTTWFIEGDIKGCFDNIDHTVLLDIIRRDIHDGRMLRLIDGLLKAGYMEDWQYHDTLSGTPQGGIISPLLANVYLDNLDKFVESVLIPAYTKGDRRRPGKGYRRLTNQMNRARECGDHEMVKRLRGERRTLTSYDPCDPNFRRLRYVRYADDFLLGLIGPKEEAEKIRDRLEEFLAQKLKLTLSPEKTLITHAHDDKAKFLGHEITVTKANDRIADDGRRATNGKIALLMPRRVVEKYVERYSRGGKPIHKAELRDETTYTIVSRFQAVLRGVYNFYCMAGNVRRRMDRIKWTLEKSLAKTLANKLKCSVSRVYEIHKAEVCGSNVLRAVATRPNKEPLTATFGGIPFKRKPEGMGVVDFEFRTAWFRPASNRSEVVQRMMADKCELCEAEGVPLQMHHIRQLRDIDRPGRRPKEQWERVMAARKRKSLAICKDCHKRIHAGRYDGPKV